MFAKPFFQRLKSIWRTHNLGIVLIGLILFQVVTSWFYGLQDWTGRIWPDYALAYYSQAWPSLLGDTYGAALIVLLTKRLREVGIPESK